jgi:Bacterial Ig domain/Bacterial Ig-like domain (group 3)
MKFQSFGGLGLLLLGLLVACPTNPSTNLPPSVGVNSPLANAILGPNPTIRLDGPTDPENNPITKIEYRIDGGSVNLLPSTDQGQTFFVSGLTEGTHTIEVTATDNQGKVTNPATKRTFRVDATPPVLAPLSVDGTSTFPTTPQKFAGALVTVVANVTDKLNATDTSNGGTSTTVIRLRLDGVVVDAGFGPTLTFSTRSLSLGSHTFVAEATDAAGNVAVLASQSLIVVEQPTQGTKPTLTLTPRTVATNGYYKGGSLFEFLWQASATTASSTFTPNAGTVATPTTASLSDLNVWTLPLVSGNYNIKGIAQDSNSPVNLSNPVFLNASVDADPPSIEFTNVVNGQNFNARPVSISYIAADALSGVRSVTLRAISGTDNVLIGINTQAQGSFLWTPTNGTYTLELTSIDNVGNTSVAINATNVKIDVPTPDTTPPTVSIDASTLPNPASGQIAITANASDPSGVAGVTLLVEGTPIATDTAAPYIFNLDTTQYPNTTISLQVRATDLVGNISANTVPIQTTIVNSRRPEFAITSPTNGATLTGLNKVTVNVAKRSTDYQFTTPITVEVLDYRGKIVATRDISTTGQPATGPLSLVENTTDIDFNGFPVDAYVIQARMTIDLAPIGSANVGDGEMITQINISNNNQSNQPPALQILSPQRLDETQSILPVYVGAGGFVIADISDNSGVSSVELRMTCESGCGVSGPVNALQQYIAYIPPVTRATAILSFNANATPYLPDGNYVLRVVAQDGQGNRNIQEVKARIDRTIPNPSFSLSSNITGANAISESEELCAGKVIYSVLGVTVPAIFKYWLFSPNGNRRDFELSSSNITQEISFDIRGTWQFNAQVQELSGQRRIIGLNRTDVAASRLIRTPQLPCPVP